MLFIIGLLSGIISGMGIGGGTILIPALIILCSVEQHIAQSINLLAFLPTAVIALIVHSKNKSIHYKLALYLSVSGILGAVIGSHIAVVLSSLILKKIFGVFLLIMGIFEFQYKEKKQ